MKTYFRHVLFILSLAIISPVLHAQDVRLGFVNTAQIMNEVPQADAARERLKNEFKSRDEKIVVLQNELKALEEEMYKNSAVMTDTARNEKELKIISLKRDIKRAKEEFNEDLNIRRNEELTKLQKQVYDTIVAVAKEKNYDVILGDSVLFASKRVDLTSHVIRKLKQDFEQATAASSAQ